MGLILTNEKISHFHLLSFWKRSAESYTILSKLARVIHCILASSVEIIHIWYLAWLIMTDRRIRMNNRNFKVNLFCSKNLDLVKTLRDPAELFFQLFSYFSIELKQRSWPNLTMILTSTDDMHGERNFVLCKLIWSFRCAVSFEKMQILI
jgi:hypothetical protein